MTPKRALVIDQANTFTIQLVRDLAAHGYRVAVFAEPGAPALRSRACHERVPSPPWHAQDEFRRRLFDTVGQGRYQAIFLCSEPILETLLPYLERARGWDAMPITAPSSLKLSFSKNQMLALADAMSVPAPRTIVPVSEEDVAKIGRELGFPIVVKGEKGSASQHVRLVHRPEDLVPTYREIAGRERRSAGRPAIQEFVPGPVYSIGGLFDNGRPLRVLAHRRLLTFPREGGRTVKGVTERPAKLLENAFALFAALDYTGLGHMDFMHDQRDGQFRFLEINPRVWGSIGLARLAGVDLYTPYAALARGELVASDLRFREGVVFHHLSREMKFIRRHPARLWSFLRDCLDPRVRSDFEWLDPAPHLLFT
ncbi:MAG: ATP-grasp domain-containing protein [Candidatus Rokubacteria bacterium]|nr:ATP-grasp domain-containing protein [Candidatus Rokubacteria bacterium]